LEQLPSTLSLKKKEEDEEEEENKIQLDSIQNWKRR